MKKKYIGICLLSMVSLKLFSQEISLVKENFVPDSNKNRSASVILNVVIPNDHDTFRFVKKRYNSKGERTSFYIDYRFSSMINRGKRKFKEFKKSVRTHTNLATRTVFCLYIEGGEKPIAEYTVYRTKDDFDEDGIKNELDPRPKNYDIDTDKDGLLDYQDDCPNLVGPKSNNGCPEGEADLTFESVEAYGYGSKPKEFQHGDIITFEVSIKNIGNKDVNSFNLCNVFISKSPTYDLYTDPLVATIHLNKIIPKNITNTYFSSYTISTVDRPFNDFPGGDFYVHFVIVCEDELKIDNNIKTDKIFVHDGSRRELSVYNFHNGSHILNKKGTLNEVLELLPSNKTYIINDNERGTSHKIRKNN